MGLSSLDRLRWAWFCDEVASFLFGTGSGFADHSLSDL